MRNKRSEQLINQKTKRSVVARFAFGTLLSCVCMSMSALTVQAQEKPRAEPVHSGKAKVKTAFPEHAADQAEPTPPTADVAGPKPIIKVDEEVHDFGTVWMGPTLKHAFTIRNEGNAALQITKVRPACGCTIAGEYPRSIEPGQSGEFPFSLNSNKLRNRFTKAITITSNDPLNPQLKLQLTGECKSYVDLSPPSAHFGRVMGDEPRERVIRITNNTEEPLQLTMPEVPQGSKYSYKLNEKEAGKEYELVIRMEPPFEPGDWREPINITTNIEKQKSLQIMTSANVPERLDLQPSTLTIRSSGTSRPATRRQIRLQNNGERPVKLIEVTSNDPKLTFETREQLEGKAYVVQVSWPDDYEPPADGATITFKTDDPEKPTLTVPVRGMQTAKRTPPPRGPHGPEQMVGQNAPAFTLKTESGAIITNSDNVITVLDFFAPNCPHCKRQIPRIEDVQKEYEAKGVRFVKIAQSMHGKKFPDDEIKNILGDLQASTDNLAIDTDNTVGPLFKATSYPSMVVLGKTGKVEAANVGNSADLESRMKAQLDALLAGEAIPSQYRTAADPDSKPRPRPEDLIGKAAPTFALDTMDGKKISSDDFANHPATVLNFVAPDCPHCKRQVPNVEKIREEYEAKGVRFVNVSQTMHKPFTDEEAKAAFTQAGSGLEIAPDKGNTVGQMFHAAGYPTMVVVGKDGKIVNVNVGNNPNIDEMLKGQLENLIKPDKSASATP